jgi:hypothetical protein
MTLSALDLFTIGIGPSSSHTVGPMRAACRFVRYLEGSGLAPQVTRLRPPAKTRAALALASNRRQQCKSPATFARLFVSFIVGSVL